MAHNRAATRYAHSLISLSQEQGLLDVVAGNMHDFTEVLKNSHDLVLVLKNPIIKHPDKLAILKKLFGNTYNNLTMAIFNIVVAKKREALLPDIAAEFVNQYNRIKGIFRASITTAAPLDADTKERINAYVRQATGGSVELTEIIDTNVIGGYKLQIGDRQIDETISGKLQELKLQLIDQSYIAKY